MIDTGTEAVIVNNDSPVRGGAYQNSSSFVQDQTDSKYCLMASVLYYFDHFSFSLSESFIPS